MTLSTEADPPTGLRIVVLNWRDSRHPEGGGSELYAESVMSGLAERGHVVTLLTARYPGSSPREQGAGFLVLRAGGRFTVYVRSLLRILFRRVGPFDVVVDVQNGMPFLARIVTRKPVVVLCHHVHREQWSIALGATRTGRLAARIGWFVESRVAPRFYRGCRYVTVSGVSADELCELGVRRTDIDVVHNGAFPARTGSDRSNTPEVLVLGRLVPHKRVEHAVRAVAELSGELPDLHLTIVGHGWWEPQIRAEIQLLGMTDRVHLTGHIDEDSKHELLGRAWVLATPSVKEGWGLCVIEAAAHGTPSVAYHGAGGVAESILDGRTGLLAQDEADFTRQLRRLLTDRLLSERLGRHARLHADQFSWSATTTAFESVLHDVTGTRPLSSPELLPTPRPSSDEERIAVRS